MDVSYIFTVLEINTYTVQKCIYTFDVQRFMHRKYIPFDIHIYNEMQLYTVIYFWKTALHVSGGIFTHHQEHI